MINTIYDLAIINYGMGNLLSIQSAAESVGLRTIVTNEKKIIEKAKSLLLPGVGAFNQAMKNINKYDIKKSIFDFNRKGKPIIGVCLGMQLFFEESNEIKKTKGLGLIKGTVSSLTKNNRKKKVDINIGWSKINIMNNYGSNLSDNLNNKKFYFIHKFSCRPKSKNVTIAMSSFSNIEFSAAVKYKNIEGYQFHPEKSGPNGLLIYKNLKKNLK